MGRYHNPRMRIAEPPELTATGGSYPARFAYARSWLQHISLFPGRVLIDEKGVLHVDTHQYMVTEQRNVRYFYEVKS